MGFEGVQVAFGLIQRGPFFRGLLYLAYHKAAIVVFHADRHGSAYQLNNQINACPGYLNMENKKAKQESRIGEVLLKIKPPLDRAYVRWLARDIERIERFAPRNPRAVKPPDNYIEFMRLNGWLDVDLDDPDLAHLFK